MKRKIVIGSAITLLVFIVIHFFDENVNYSKEESMGVWKITDGLYRETYRVYGGGVFGGDIRTVYLTDSLSFRKYIGQISDHEQIRFSHIDKSQIKVYKLNFDKLSKDLKMLPPDTVKVVFYSLFELKDEGKWE